MKYIVDNDLHIHSQLSLCSNDPLQNNEAILNYAIDNKLKTICLTNHFWDDAIPGANEWYEKQNYSHISSALPLPQSDEVRFLFGCEADLDLNLRLGVSKEKLNCFDFIVISTTHFHHKGFTTSEIDTFSANNRAITWIKRLDAVLNMDLPFHKIGIAHLACYLISPSREEYLEVLSLLPEDEMRRLFTRAARLGIGIELNATDMSFDKSEANIVLRPFKIAKECGCKFYFGSDAHHPQTFKNSVKLFRRAVKLLHLTEDDKFILS